MSSSSGHVVLVDDDRSFRQIIGRELERSGYSVTAFADANGVRAHCAHAAPDVVLVDLRMPGASGLELLGELRADDPDLQVIVLTGHGAVPEAVEAMRLGASDFLTKPVRLEVLDQALGRAMHTARLLAENRRLRLASGRSNPSVELPSAESRRLERQIARVAATGSSVLVLGESGVGKELVARQLHDLSERKDALFVPVNCGAIPQELIESELFGHTKGAFTGATKERTGLFEAADGGTLFLDEIGELPLALQPTLLRALQFGEIRRIGEESVRHVDVRIVAATNRDLRESVANGRFREDLFYRLAVIELRVAPLRERPEDVLALARHFLQREAARARRPLTLSSSAEQWLSEQQWPGNVRELENAIVRAAVLTDHDEIGVAQLVSAPLARSAATAAVAPELPTLCIRDLETLAIEAALRRSGGNKRLAAEELGIALKTLYNKLSRLEG